MSLESVVADYARRYQFRKMEMPADGEATPLPAPDPDRRYLLYLHVPFCVVLCPFCSFHRQRYEAHSAARYFANLQREIDIASDAGYRFDELYVGGGTPTVEPEELARTIGHVRRLHAITGISVETNPDDLARDSVARLTEAGVNRLSVGVQSFDDGLLAEMHRLDRYGSGADIAGRLAAVAGHFATLNVDMIFNLPHQTEASLRHDLRVLTDEAAVDQVSFYPLMTVASARSGMHRAMGKVDYGRERGFYEIIADYMLAHGYTRTSAWCFSRTPGMFDEYIVEREEYLGLGSGSFSFLQGSLYASTFSLPQYERMIGAGTTAMAGRMVLSERDRMRYYLLMTLFGGSLDKAAAERRFRGGFLRRMWPELTLLQAIGAVRNTGVQLALTEKGYYLWVMLMREFFTGVNNLREQMRHARTPGSAPRGPVGKGT